MASRVPHVFIHLGWSSATRGPGFPVGDYYLLLDKRLTVFVSRETPEEINGALGGFRAVLTCRKYPYSVAALPSALDKHWDSPDFAPYRTAFPEPAASSRAEFEACFADLVRADVKVAHLKALQGFLWRAGYESGEVRAPLFADVAPAMSSWVSAGLKIMIYSSGSVPAQKLFFRYTDSQPSDQSPLITDWFDTVNAGSKVEASSYQKIQSCHAEFKAHEWLFLSDNLNEVQAAQDAGMQSLPVVRPGNAELPAGHPLAESVVSDFGELALGHA